MLLYFTSGNSAGVGEVLAGQGDGSALWPTSGNDCAIFSGRLADVNGDNPLQVANAYASLNGSGLPDLFTVGGDAVNGYSLNYFTNAFIPCAYSQNFTTSTTLTPDGTADWNKWTIATLSDNSGTGMFPGTRARVLSTCGRASLPTTTATVPARSPTPST